MLPSLSSGNSNFSQGFVQADQWLIWGVRACADLRHVFHVRRKRCVGSRRNDPLFLQVRLETVFFERPADRDRWSYDLIVSPLLARTGWVGFPRESVRDGCGGQGASTAFCGSAIVVLSTIRTAWRFVVGNRLVNLPMIIGSAHRASPGINHPRGRPFKPCVGLPDMGLHPIRLLSILSSGGGGGWGQMPGSGPSRLGYEAHHPGAERITLPAPGLRAGLRVPASFPRPRPVRPGALPRRP